MISRFYVKCDVCGSHHTLRIQMGLGVDQKHRFYCHQCNEPITFDLLSIYENTRIEVTGATQCDSDESSESETNYQYLSPDFVADENEARSPFYSGAMEIMDSMLNAPEVISAMESGVDLADFSGRQWNPLVDTQSDWGVLLRSWRLERSGNYRLARLQLKKIDKEGECVSPWQAIVRFTERLFGCDDALIKEVLGVRRQYSNEFSRLVTRYESGWRSSLHEGLFQVFGEFFRRWDAFSQVYLYVKSELDMPKVPVATSMNFEAVRGFYSLAQEFISKQICLLTAINNVKSGRSFDRLENISIDKYLNTDNAKRLCNFADNKVLSAACCEYDSSLRNAEAHNWIMMKTGGRSLFYKQGGNGPEVNLTYVSYLYKSTALFKQICHLVQVEYLLDEVARTEAYGLLSVPREV